MADQMTLELADNLLKEYDLYHNSLIFGGKIKFNINYLFDGKVYISLVGLIGDVERKSTYDFENNDYFNKVVLPKIIERFLSKNVGIKARRIMGNDENGTYIVERADSKDSLIIRNCSKEVMDTSDRFIKALSNLNDFDYSNNKRIIIEENSNLLYDNYMKYNLIFDYAQYKNAYFKSNSTLAFDIESSINDEEDVSALQLLILNIARYAYMFEGNAKENLWDEIKSTYKDQKAVEDICDNFKELDLSEDSLYADALMLAEFEKNHDMFLHNNDAIVQEAIAAVESGVNYFDESYDTYFTKKQEYYSSILDTQREIVCLDFLDSHSLGETLRSVELKNKVASRVEKRETSFIDTMKDIQAKKLAFATIINEPSEDDDDDAGYKVENFDEIYSGAEDQARIIFDVIQERDQIKKDAEEFAKQIIMKEKEHKEIIDASMEQAQRIIELENENKELKRLAQENAQDLFDRDKRMQEEQRLREIIDESPIKAQDIDKINNLLNAISSCKDIDFAVNHPTVMQELAFLEEKIITYLTTHKNIVHEEIVFPSLEKEEMLESKPVIELLSMIRNAYVTSHQYEKYGRHTVINFVPVDEDTFRVTLYSVKDDDDDILMDAFFEDYQLTDSVLEQLCNIFKDDAVIVASKVDNVPPDKADYLVLDNMNNAIKFMGCSRKLIDTVKSFL
ncbi:MAG: hypothetical protein IKO78_04845 [Bacilli bacterium]|nr:hypothetical protein [Bacilli bacterium]